jgi:hypothetical protein
MMQFATPLLPLCEMLTSMWDENNYMCFFQPHLTTFIDESHANVIWSLKGLEGPHVYTLVMFFHQKVLITLQRMQASLISNRGIIISLITSSFPPFHDTPLIITTDLLQVVDF